MLEGIVSYALLCLAIKKSGTSLVLIEKGCFFLSLSTATLFIDIKVKFG